MAKDGTNRGGARPGAGRKKKALADKIMEGKALPLGPEKSPLAAGGKQALEEFLALAETLK